MKKVVAALAVALTAASFGASATESSWVDDINRWGPNEHQFVIADVLNGVRYDAYEDYRTTINEYVAKGYDGTGVHIAVSEPDYLQRVTGFNIGDYNMAGGHRARMARMAGGEWVDEQGDIAYGVARGATVTTHDMPGSTRRTVEHVETWGSWYSTQWVPNRSNDDLVNASIDIISGSYGTSGVDTKGYDPKTGQGFGMVDVILEHNSQNNSVVYVTSAGNESKNGFAITDGNVQALLNEDLDEHLLIVTGDVQGNRAANEAQAARMITSAYVTDGIGGTSHATAAVSGSMAIVMNVHGVDSIAAADALLSTASDSFAGYNKMHHGQGRIDLRAALSPIGSIR